jgi:hypothetical protein
MMVLIGASLGGLFLILKELAPLLGALSSGVIHTRGHRRQKVERAVDPERFKALCRNRYKGIGLGLLAIAVGVGWVVAHWLMKIARDPMAWMPVGV